MQRVRPEARLALLWWASDRSLVHRDQAMHSMISRVRAAKQSNVKVPSKGMGWRARQTATLGKNHVKKSDLPPHNILVATMLNGDG